jgi:hypothetical protein
MHYFSPKHSFIQLGLFFLLTFFSATTEACVCLDHGLEFSYNDPEQQVTRVRILGKIKRNIANYYIAVVKEKYNKGSYKKNDYIIIKSGTHSCGVNYDSNGLWVVSIEKSDSGGEGTYHTSACGFNKKFKDMTPKELDYLKAGYKKEPKE